MNWVTEARKQVEGVLSSFPRSLTAATKETAVESLCKELEKIPVPFVGTILSKALKQALKWEDGRCPTIEDVLRQLQNMQLSDDNFLQGLTRLGEDIDRLNVLIELVEKKVEETKCALTVPELIISEPEYRPKYPLSDNELIFCLMNIGGGAVKVHEINLVIDKWEPETEVNYTAPAAPPIFLRLKVRLSPGTSHYPLLTLNKEPFRRFGAHAEGAEDVWVQMSSEKNARYYVRIRIPYTEIPANNDKELVYPPLDKPPLPVSFPYAPAWDQNITPDNMLERGAVLTEILNTFSKVTLILKEATPSDEIENYESFNQSLSEIGFHMGVYYVPYVLSRFIPPLVQIAQKENRPDVLAVILGLAHQSMRFKVHFGF
ncbi:MAG: hypothetical protein EFT35_02200 [Methanophagales archaeon ANME-1-THS]|nr:MAG: hypothetical protein EFT35_02200 [Methanophagales archaeon ANME-1-THS]